jgi:hypothetical protein
MDVTRGQFATFLWRIAGRPNVNPTHRFADVPAGMFFTTPVAWAHAHNIVEGLTPTTFGSYESITREQLAAMLFRYIRYIGGDTSSTPGATNRFNDAGRISSWAVGYMNWAAYHGILGRGTDSLNPTGNARRSETVATLNRVVNMFSIIAPPTLPTPVPPLPPTPTPPPTPIPTPVPTPHPTPPIVEGGYFLETDIHAISRTSVLSHPPNVSFSLGGVNYFRGIRSQDVLGNSPNPEITYNIDGRGFTRLTGLLGTVGGRMFGGVDALTINRINVDGSQQFLAGFVLEDGVPIPIDVAIPAGTMQIRIIMQRSGIGIADAAFSRGTAQASPTHTMPSVGEAYLESDIHGTISSGLNGHPRNGSFSMGGVRYFRGLVSQSLSITNFNATYNVEGRGFTELTGMFGRVGTRAGTMTVNYIRTGESTERLLQSFDMTRDGLPRRINVTIPANAARVIVRMNTTDLALGDAMFISR